MMMIADPPQTPDVARLYDEARAEDGYVMNLARVWAWRIDVHDAFSAARGALAAGTSLTAREIAVLNAATASARRDAYCSLAWGSRLAGLTDDATAAAVIRGEDEALNERERALAAWARRVARDPNATGDDDLAALRTAGCSEREIVDATLFVAFRIAFMTVNEALGARPDRELAAAAPAAVRASVTFGRAVDDGALAQS